MLVLTRKENERVMIGDDIIITVVRIEKGKIRIGIEAPKETVIVREELLQEEGEEDEREAEM